MDNYFDCTYKDEVLSSISEFSIPLQSDNTFAIVTKEENGIGIGVVSSCSDAQILDFTASVCAESAYYL